MSELETLANMYEREGERWGTIIDKLTLEMGHALAMFTRHKAAARAARVLVNKMEKLAEPTEK